MLKILKKFIEYSLQSIQKLWYNKMQKIDCMQNLVRFGKIWEIYYRCRTA